VVNFYASELPTVVNEWIYNGTTFWLYYDSAWLIPTHYNSQPLLMSGYTTVKHILFHI